MADCLARCKGGPGSPCWARCARDYRACAKSPHADRAAVVLEVAALKRRCRRLRSAIRATEKLIREQIGRLGNGQG